MSNMATCTVTTEKSQPKWQEFFLDSGKGITGDERANEKAVTKRQKFCHNFVTVATKFGVFERYRQIAYVIVIKYVMM